MRAGLLYYLRLRHLISVTMLIANEATLMAMEPFFAKHKNRGKPKGLAANRKSCTI